MPVKDERVLRQGRAGASSRTSRCSVKDKPMKPETWNLKPYLHLPDYPKGKKTP
jgi:hypothetical protein